MVEQADFFLELAKYTPSYDNRIKSKSCQIHKWMCVRGATDFGHQGRISQCVQTEFSKNKLQVHVFVFMQ